MLEKAQTRQRAYQPEPPCHELVDIARLGIVFDTGRFILSAFQALRKSFDCVWVENKFRAPTVLG